MTASNIDKDKPPFACLCMHSSRPVAPSFPRCTRSVSRLSLLKSVPPFLVPPSPPPFSRGTGRRMPPKYPVVDPAPTLDTVTANFGLGEYGVWIGVTALAVPLGHFAGM